MVSVTVKREMIAKPVDININGINIRVLKANDSRIEYTSLNPRIGYSEIHILEKPVENNGLNNYKWSHYSRDSWEISWHKDKIDETTQEILNRIFWD